MRLAFSTLGCPEWPLDRVARAAAEYGFQGVEIRGVQEHVDLRQSPWLSPGRIAATRRMFEDAGIAICCLGASASFADPSKREASLQEARDYVDLAALLGCPYVRVFGGKVPDGHTFEESVQPVADCLSDVAEYADQSGCSLVLETHDSFNTGARVAAALGRVPSRGLGALWDMHHPYREGELPEETMEHLRGRVYHAHVKDSRNGRYTLLGGGDLPVPRMISALRMQGELPAFLCVEWEKRWHPEIEAPEVALPQYAATLRRYLGDSA